MSNTEPVTESITESKVALVTGASRGIGAAIARRLAATGIKVACVARTLSPNPAHEGSLSETVEQITRAGGTAIAIAADLTNPKDQISAIDKTEQALGPVDVLINNAGMTYLKPFEDMSEAEYQAMFEVHLHSAFRMTQRVASGMKARGRGWIINISSQASLHPTPPYPPGGGGMTIYGVVKAAQERMTTGLASELAHAGIVVNSLAPAAVVSTPGARGIDTGIDFTQMDIPLEDPAMMAESALFLANCNSDFTGQITLSLKLMEEKGLTPALL